MTQGPALHCVTLVLVLTATQQNTRIDSDPVLAFLCVAFLCLVPQNCEFMKISHYTSSTQHTYCEPTSYTLGIMHLCVISTIEPSGFVSGAHCCMWLLHSALYFSCRGVLTLTKRIYSIFPGVHYQAITSIGERWYWCKDIKAFKAEVTLSDRRQVNFILCMPFVMKYCLFVGLLSVVCSIFNKISTAIIIMECIIQLYIYAVDCTI